MVQGKIKEKAYGVSSPKKLGFGLMRLPLTDPDDAGSIDIEASAGMVDAFLARGYTYLDTAWMYHREQSESAAKDFLVSRHPRDSFTLATKLHAAYFETARERDQIFQTQLERSGAGYFDYYLLHDLGRDNYEKFQRLHCFEFLQEQKAAGLIRHIGFSSHEDGEHVDQLLSEHPEMEFIQLQLNYLDWDSEGIQSRRCYEAAVRHDKDVVVMEPVKGGILAKVPPAVEQLFRDYAPERSPAAWAIRFAASLDKVRVVLSGMSTQEQLDDNTLTMQDFEPMNDAELAIIREAARMLRDAVGIPCTGCAYCTGGCPMNIPIPRYFSLYNTDQHERDREWTPQHEYYERSTLSFGKASDCIACGQCEEICPQHLPIIRHLQTVAAHFEHEEAAS